MAVTEDQSTDNAEDGRDNLLADLERLQDDGSLSEGDAEESGEDESEEDEEAESEDDADDAEDSEDEDTDEDDEDDEESEEEADDEESEDAGEEDDDAPDPVAAKRIEQIQSEEKRAKNAVAAERQQLEQERQSLAEYKEQVAEFQNLRKRASYDPLSVLDSLGVAESDYEAIAKQLYLISKAQEKPEYREKAKELSMMRGNTAEVSELKAEIQKLREEREQEKTAATEQQQADQYLDSVKSALNGKTPLVSKLYENAPEKARSKAADIAVRLAKENGGTVPTPDAVLSELEKEHREELKALGYEPEQPGKKARTKKTKTKSKATKTKTAAKKEKTKERTPTEQPSREEIFEGWPD